MDRTKESERARERGGERERSDLVVTVFFYLIKRENEFKKSN
jgi:hypothetical protein